MNYLHSLRRFVLDFLKCVWGNVSSLPRLTDPFVSWSSSVRQGCRWAAQLVLDLKAFVFPPGMGPFSLVGLWLVKESELTKTNRVLSLHFSKLWVLCFFDLHNEKLNKFLQDSISTNFLFLGCANNFLYLVSMRNKKNLVRILTW